MASRTQNFVVDINTDFSANVYAYANGSATSPLNLTGYESANAQVKRSYYTSEIAATFNVAIRDATAGIVNLYLNRANTAKLTPRNYVYDVMINNDAGERLKILDGMITVKPGVSR